MPRWGKIVVKKCGFLLVFVMCYSTLGLSGASAGLDIDGLIQNIKSQKNIESAIRAYESATNYLRTNGYYSELSNDIKEEQKKNIVEPAIQAAMSGQGWVNSSEEKKKGKKDNRTDEQKAADLAEKQSAYDSAKATEQSTANKLLTGLTTAATGIWTMEALRGLSEQQADKNADADMDAYIATMRCSYADGKSVKAGSEPIELPGGNDEDLMKYRNEYIALATSLKTRKESLGMNPGLESELILDKADMGFYDQENVGITEGKYSSLYRAKMQNSETDKTEIEEESQKSAKRLKYGAIAAGAGVAVGVIGNSAINGKLNEMIKEVKGKISNNRANRNVISTLKKGLESAGLINVNDLDFSKLDLGGMQDIINKIDFSKMASGLKGKSATDVLNTSNKTSFISSLIYILGDKNASLFE